MTNRTGGCGRLSTIVVVGRYMVMSIMPRSQKMLGIILGKNKVWHDICRRTLTKRMVKYLSDIRQVVHSPPRKIILALKNMFQSWIKVVRNLQCSPISSFTCMPSKSSYRLRKRHSPIGFF